MQHPLCALFPLLSLFTSFLVEPSHAQYYPGAANADNIELAELFENGKADARKALKTHSLRYKWAGLPMRWDSDFAKVVATRYGVTIDFGGCIVTPEDEAYWSGYNGIVRQEIKRRYDGETISQLYSDVVQNYYSTHPGESALNIEVLKQARHTEEAERARIEGRVYLWFDIGIDGIPHNVRVVKGLGFGLDEDAIRVVRMLRFAPAEDQENALPSLNYSGSVRYSLGEH